MNERSEVLLNEKIKNQKKTERSDYAQIYRTCTSCLTFVISWYGSVRLESKPNIGTEQGIYTTWNRKHTQNLQTLALRNVESVCNSNIQVSSCLCHVRWKVCDCFSVFAQIFEFFPFSFIIPAWFLAFHCICYPCAKHTMIM